MRGTDNTSWNLLKIVTSVLFLQFLAKMTLSDGNIYRLGHSFGKELRETDEDFDLKDLDQAITEFEESLGGDQGVIGKLVNDTFREGAQHGYYSPEYSEELLDDIGGEVGKTGG